MMDDHILPFSALVGLDQVKQALLMLAVNPRLNGVLIRGEKGTAKSTAARSLSRLLPPIRTIEGCSFGCPGDRPHAWCDECREKKNHRMVELRPPFYTLPLGITEDRLLGTIDIEHALRHGEKRFEAGLLAKVNQGVLYIDEVNLLHDHIVDMILDVSTTGRNIVAREGISICHPSEFLLIGTKNPEEGDLRPQILDRFGLCVQPQSLKDPELRSLIISRTLDFEKDPAAFHERWAGEEKLLREKIERARKIIQDIELDHNLFMTVSGLSLSLDVEGHRADILMVKASATLAALEGKNKIGEEEFEKAAAMVYSHRMKRRPFEEEKFTIEEINQKAKDIFCRMQKSKKKNYSIGRTGLAGMN